MCRFLEAPQFSLAAASSPMARDMEEDREAAQAPPIPPSKVGAAMAVLGRPILPDMAALTAPSHHPPASAAGGGMAGGTTPPSWPASAAVAAMAVALTHPRMAARAVESFDSPSQAR